MRRLLRDQVLEIFKSISPYDVLEREHRLEDIDWLQSGGPFIRTESPCVPSKHLVCYFLPYDEENQQILLGDHIKGERWLPPGGHVDEGEHPKTAARREAREELGIEAEFWKDQPLFLSKSVTQLPCEKHEKCQHTDVALWYVIALSKDDPLTVDYGEYHKVKWFKLKNLPEEGVEEHLKRFCQKVFGL